MIAAARDIDISAQSVDIRTADNHGRSRQSECDLKIGTFAKISSPLIDLVNAAEGAAKSKADGRTAIDPISGKFNPNLLPEHIKEEIKAQTGALASVVGAAGGSLKGGEQKQHQRHQHQCPVQRTGRGRVGAERGGE
ncbi:hypothetical protein [Neisseria lactamica]|uniref:hypothetical protein n=1 Tax=Neisseria lactamica TaxID=486 RepID=UPI001EDD7CB1|nr:hypothetical protein [Neisseria lactamica]